MARLAGSTASDLDRMDTSYLTQQVANIIAQLHGLFDEIGVDAQERDRRESELFAALSDTLHKQVKQVASERQQLVDQASHLSSEIKQFTAALDDETSFGGRGQGESSFEVTYPLRSCVKSMQDKHKTAQKLHMDRFDQVRKLVVALHSYASHLEPSFVKVKLPPNLTNPNSAPDAVSNDCPPTFSLSPSYIANLDTEFTRVYEEYHRRANSVRTISREIIDLWAELGTPDAQTDHRIIEYANESPEQLGLRSEDMQQLVNRRERLLAEKTSREKKIAGMMSTIKDLWDRLGIEQAERNAFLNANRGAGLRTISACDEELARLNEIKKRNMGIFIEEARCRLQALWDDLFFSEEEMLAFTPAWSDAFTDALLASHESEIARLEKLAAQRKPILALIARHQSLLNDRSELESSSQDASRLMLRGQKGERRDPGKLLREEKMRKRITKDLPRIESELREELDRWHRDFGKEFLVRGKPYTDELETSASNSGPPRAGAASSMALSRPKSFVSMNPNASMLVPPGAGSSMLRSSKSTNFAASTRQAPAPASARAAPPSRSKTPTSFGTSRAGNPSVTMSASTVRGHSRTQTAHELGSSATVSPSRLPARAPLGTMRDTNASHYPPRPMSTSPTRIGKPNTSMIGTVRSPPKMKDLFMPPSPAHGGPPSPTPASRVGVKMGNPIVRTAAPEDVYDDRAPSRLRLQHYPIFNKPPQSAAMVSAMTSAAHLDSSISSQSNLSNSWQNQYDYLHTPRMPHSATSSTGRPESTVVSVMSAPSAAAASALMAATNGTRQTSHSSSATSVSTCDSIGASALVGSENWETYGGDEDEEEQQPTYTPRANKKTGCGSASPAVVDEEVTLYQRQQQRYYEKLKSQRPVSQNVSPERFTPASRLPRADVDRDVAHLTSTLAGTRLAGPIGETF